MRPRYNQTVTIGKNLATYAADTYESHIGSVNSVGLTIAGKTIGAREALMKGISGTKAVRNGVNYYAVIFEIEFDVDTFDMTLVDQGAYFRDDDDEVQLCLRAGEHVVDLLDGSGGRLGSGATAVYGTFKIYEETAWSGLSLDVS